MSPDGPPPRGEELSRAPFLPLPENCGVPGLDRCESHTPIEDNGASNTVPKAGFLGGPSLQSIAATGLRGVGGGGEREGLQTHTTGRAPAVTKQPLATTAKER